MWTLPEKLWGERLPKFTIRSFSLWHILLHAVISTSCNCISNVHLQNFLALCASGFYNDCTFHRNIKGFMVQTGDPTGMEWLKQIAFFESERSRIYLISLLCFDSLLRLWERWNKYMGSQIWRWVQWTPKSKHQLNVTLTLCPKTVVKNESCCYNPFIHTAQCKRSSVYGK